MAKRRLPCQTNPELFFPVGSGGLAIKQADEAVQLCHTCPIMQACREQAFRLRAEFGVWGGMRENERRDLLRRGYGREFDEGTRSPLVGALDSETLASRIGVGY